MNCLFGFSLAMGLVLWIATALDTVQTFQSKYFMTLQKLPANFLKTLMWETYLQITMGKDLCSNTIHYLVYGELLKKHWKLE